MPIHSWMELCSAFGIYSPALQEVAMVACDIYRQRAVECERMAQKHPAERDQLIETARTWRFLAQAAECLSAIAEVNTIH